ncbi:MAG: hypothetical protein C0402_07170 [Thermodesulfovibrio sp.]|nr:hypothetical protein [Thermodesulfovibrio sp.]
MAEKHMTKKELTAELERLRAELALAQADKAAADAVIEGLGDAISIQDRDFRILYQNRKHRDYVGEHAGEYCYRAYSGADHVCPDCAVEKAFADGKTYRLEKSRPADGGEFFVEIIASPLRDVHGEIYAGVEAVRDITDRVRMQRALQESEARYRMLFESAVDAVFIIDAEGENTGRIIEANRAAAGMHGYTAHELVGMKISDLDTPEVASKAPERIKNIASGEWLKTELMHQRKDGTVFPLEVSAGLLEIGGHKYILALDRDISDRRAAEAEQEKLISELRDALQKIKTLKGLLPICAWCKKVRDDHGYWKGVEKYIEEHSAASFTHGICPDCLKKNDPELYDMLLKNPDLRHSLMQNEDTDTAET